MKKFPLHYQILAAILLGGLYGFYLTDYVGYVDWLGIIFMRALRMIVAPLVFCMVMTGVASISATDGFLRLGGKALGYYLATTFVAILTGLALVNWIKPGKGLNIELPEASSALVTTQMTLRDFLINIVPDNIFAALSTNNMIGIILFALFFGFFLGKSKHEGTQKVLKGFESIGDVILNFTLFILKFAPLGIFGLIAGIVAAEASTPEQLRDMVGSQGLYLLTVTLGLAFHLFVTMSVILWVFGRINPIRHIQRMKDVMLMAFSTASSAATLPLLLSHVKSRCGVSDKIANFTLPLGTTINMNGTALYEGIVVLFIAQVYGMDLTLSQQLFVLLAALMVGIGAAGIPMASLVMTVMIIQMVGLPPESVGLILLVDRFLDMGRTCVNVYGDTVCTTLIAKSEGEKVAT